MPPEVLRVNHHFKTFAEESPATVMMRELMEVVFRPERLDTIFAEHSKVQYQRELLFSSCGELFEQRVQIEREGKSWTIRRVVLRLLKKIRH